MAALLIDGAVVRDIPSLYRELNRVFMTGEDWSLGESLDALDDVLYGGYGMLHGAARPVQIVWLDHDVSRAALGREPTAAYYREKLRHPETFDTARFAAKLAELADRRGATYFDLVLEVFAGHDDVELILA